MQGWLSSVARVRVEYVSLRGEILDIISSWCVLVYHSYLEIVAPGPMIRYSDVPS